jgi:hypothetical protein
VLSSYYFARSFTLFKKKAVKYIMALNGFKFICMTVVTLEWGLSDPAQPLNGENHQHLQGYQLVFILGMVLFYMFQSFERRKYKDHILSQRMESIKDPSIAVKQVIVLEEIIDNLHLDEYMILLLGFIKENKEILENCTSDLDTLLGDKYKPEKFTKLNLEKQNEDMVLTPSNIFLKEIINYWIGKYREVHDKQVA